MSVVLGPPDGWMAIVCDTTWCARTAMLKRETGNRLPEGWRQTRPGPAHGPDRARHACPDHVPVPAENLREAFRYLRRRGERRRRGMFSSPVEAHLARLRREREERDR